MSRNYELLKQAGLEQEPGLAPDLKVSPSLVPPKVPVNGEGGLNLNRLGQEEALKLVQGVFLGDSKERPRLVVFAGVDQGGGCSRICTQVGKTLAGSVTGSVCIVDGNLRSSSLPREFGVGSRRGLTDALLGEGPVRGFVQPLQPENLWLLPSGSLAADSAALLKSDRLKSRFAELRAEFDHVVIDAPPLNQYADAITFGQLADGVVFVLEANATRRAAAQHAKEVLEGANVRLLGAVLSNRTYPIPEALYRKL